MKYQVTFYKNSMEMLTERKANFVHKIQKISSNITKKIANRCGSSGTSAQKIHKKLGKNFNFQFHVDELKELKIIVNFIKSTNNLLISAKTKFLNFQNGIVAKELIINIESNGLSVTQNEIITKLHKTISHELTHIFEYKLSDKESIKIDEDPFIEKLYYFLSEQEMRAHCMEMITLSKGNKRFDFYKNWKEIVNYYFGKLPHEYYNFLLLFHMSYISSISSIKQKYFQKYFSPHVSKIFSSIPNYQFMKNQLENLISELKNHF